MQLSLRLQTIADMVTQGGVLADVGCDHGYLPVYLVLNKKISGAIAMDVGKGPLSRAKEHILAYGLEQYIETRLSDGLTALKPGEADTLVIAGMGGPLMEQILTKGSLVTRSFREMILQPQSDIGHFRRFIRQQGWEIIREEMVLEDGKFYPMMKVVPAGYALTPWQPEEEMFGRLLLEQHHPVLKKYLIREERIRRDILNALADTESPGARKRKEEIEKELQLIFAAQKRYESI